jgi:hypothetical protein
MEPTNFDDFIKSNSKDDLPVPTELNWENMNFTLTQAKRKPRILPWMLFLLIGALGIGSGLWYVYQRDITQSPVLSKNDPAGKQNQNGKIILKKEDDFADTAHPQDAGENTVTGNDVTNEETLKPQQLAKPASANPQDAGENTITPNNATNQETLKAQRLAKAASANPQDAGENTVTPNNATNQETFKRNRLAKAASANPQDAGENTVTSNKTANQETSQTQRVARAEGDKPLSLSKTVKSNDPDYSKAASLLQTESSQFDSTEKNKQASLKLTEPNTLPNVLPVEPVRPNSSENQLAASSHANSNTKHAKKSIKPVDLLVSIGTNKAQMNHNSAGLRNAVTPAWGNSFQILLERKLKNNWLVSVGAGYQRLHTTFNFEKDLGTSIDYSQFQIIRKTRQVFHNNYFDLVSLNLGGGKQFKLSPRWDGELLMYLSPSRRLNYTGKSLDDTGSVVAFDPNLVVQKKWLLNADAALRFSYRMKKMDLIIGVNFSQSLTKADVQSAGSSTTTVQPRVFGFNLGIRRSLGMRKK